MMDYDFDLQEDRSSSNFCKDQVALARWIQRALLTERNTYPQYSDNYGVELEHLKGTPRIYQNYRNLNIQDTIEDALLVREEIRSVDHFSFKDVPNQPDAIQITFQVHTIYGEWYQQMIWSI